MESRNKLSIKDLTHYFIADGKRVCAIDDVSLDVKEKADACSMHSIAFPKRPQCRCSG